MPAQTPRTKATGPTKRKENRKKKKGLSLIDRWKNRRRLKKKAKEATESRRNEARKESSTRKKAKKAFTQAGSGHRGKNAYENVIKERGKEIYKERTDLRDKTPSKPKKFDYRNKMGTQMSYKKAVKNARGRTASDIANDPAFFSNTSKGKYLRGIHKGLSKKGMMGGGMVKYSGGGSVKGKPTNKISAGNKWN